MYIFIVDLFVEDIFMVFVYDARRVVVWYELIGVDDKEVWADKSKNIPPLESFVQLV